MKLVAIGVAFLATAAWAAEIPQGTHVLLRLINSVSTRTARDGDYIYMRTAVPITVNGQIVVPEASYVQGAISQSKRSGRVKGRAELSIRIENLTLPDGKLVRVTPRLASVEGAGSDQQVAGKENEIKQGGDIGKDAVRVGTLAGTGAVVGGIAAQSWRGAGIGGGAGAGVGLASLLFTRGREVELRQGSTIDVIFESAVTVDGK